MNTIWDWVEKIATIGSIVLLIWAILTGIRKWIKGYIVRTQLRRLEGTWYEYHWTNPDGANTGFKWLMSTLKVKSGFFSSYKLVYKNNGDKFTGTARYIDKRYDELSGDILLKVQNKENLIASEETMYFRYNIPERQIGDNNNNEIAGIWLSYNFDKDITSGASILSRNKIPQDELDAKFDEYFEINKVSIVVRNNGNRGKKKSRKSPNLWEKIMGNSISVLLVLCT
ncbi:MAG: hypothetical protein LBC76_02325 [Treponema sp.]|nr:hypothetical protein [Treponema sp.]